MTGRRASERSSTKKVPAKAKRRASPARKSASAAAAGTKTRRSASPKKAKKAASRGAKAAKGASKRPAIKKSKTSAPSAGRAGRIEVRNVNVPGYRTTVDARRYHAMKSTLLAVVPNGEPGLTQAEMFSGVRGKLPEDVFPGQEKAEWWVKCVHLDLEAKGEMKRTATKPIRWHRV